MAPECSVLFKSKAIQWVTEKLVKKKAAIPSLYFFWLKIPTTTSKPHLVEIFTYLFSSGAGESKCARQLNWHQVIVKALE